MQFTKHIGIEAGTNSRIALILTVMPDNENCLIVNTDRLPADLKDNFTHALGSHEGQAATNLADVLSRRLYSDSGKNLLQTLHEYGYIRKVPLESVVMTPSPSYKIPLRTVLVESGLISRPIDARETKFNPHNFNAQAANVGEALGTARNLLIEADLLEQSAKEKREQAFHIAPSLRPGHEPKETAIPVDLPGFPGAAATAAPLADVPAIPPLTAADLAAQFSAPDADPAA